MLRNEGLVDGLLDLGIFIRHPAEHPDRCHRHAARGEEVHHILLHRIRDLLLAAPQSVQRIFRRHFAGRLLDASTHFFIHHVRQRAAWVPIEEPGRVFLGNERRAGESHAEPDAVAAFDPDRLVGTLNRAA